MKLRELFTFHPFPLDSASGTGPLIEEIEERGKLGEILGLLGQTSVTPYILTLKQEVNL